MYFTRRNISWKLIGNPSITNWFKRQSTGDGVANVFVFYSLFHRTVKDGPDSCANKWQLHLKCSVFCDMTSCSSLRVNWNSWGTYILSREGRVSHARNQYEACDKNISLLPALYLFWLAYILSPKIKEICSREKLIGFYRSTRLYGFRTLWTVSVRKTVAPNTTLISRNQYEWHEVNSSKEST
jgi:hypothetical protein